MTVVVTDVVVIVHSLFRWHLYHTKILIPSVWI